MSAPRRSGSRPLGAPNRPGWLKILALWLPLAQLVGADALATSASTGVPEGGRDRVGVHQAGPRPPTAWGELGPSEAGWGSIELLGQEVSTGETRELSFIASESFEALSVKTPVVVVRGAYPGPTLCLTAAVHGDELNGIEIVRHALEQAEPAKLRGTLVGVPIVNILGFQRSSRYLPDRRDLNRYFPGDPRGSSASRIAHSFFERVIRRCDALVDFHTGSFHRANLPQVRGDLRDQRVLDLAKGFGAAVAVHGPGQVGTLRRAAIDAGVPAIIYEAGEPMRFQKKEIDRGVDGVANLMSWLGLTKGKRGASPTQQIYYESHWVRVDRGGILVSDLSLGTRVRERQVLGVITDPMRTETAQVVSPYRGRVIGMALSPVVIPGFAVFNIGLEGKTPQDVEASEAGAAVEDVDFEEERPE